MEKRKIVRGIILAVLLVCAVFLIYSIVTDPLGEHDIMLALAVTAGFILSLIHISEPTRPY